MVILQQIQNKYNLTLAWEHYHSQCVTARRVTECWCLQHIACMRDWCCPCKAMHAENRNKKILKKFPLPRQNLSFAVHRDCQISQHQKEQRYAMIFFSLCFFFLFFFVITRFSPCSLSLFIQQVLPSQTKPIWLHPFVF